MWNQAQSSFAFFSDDGGRTWERGEEMTRDASDECEAVELLGGAVYMNMRSRHGIKRRAHARSYDGGRTWTVSNVLHEGLASYSDLAVVDGHILCFHEADQGGRMILCRFGPEWVEG